MRLKTRGDAAKDDGGKRSIAGNSDLKVESMRPAPPVYFAIAAAKMLHCNFA